jgi:hypothetical protein
VTKWRQKLQYDVRNMEHLKTEKSEIIEYVQNMKIMLQRREEPKEATTRWILIREREHRCALGDENACDYFHSTYLTQDELLKHGVPMKNEQIRKERFVYDYTPQELDAYRNGKGLEKIRAAICPIKDLLPDNQVRTFVRLEEYYEYMKQYGMKHKEHIPMRKLRKERTLFGKFLENGEIGVLTFWITYSECVGLLFSPIIFIYDGLLDIYHYIIDRLWDGIDYCYDHIPYQEEEEVKREIIKISNAAANAIPEEQEEKGLLQVVLQTIFKYTKRFCRFILDAEVDDSPTAMVLSYLDYTQNPYLSVYADAIYERTISFFWFWEIASRAPWLYYEYYILAKYQSLPPRRHACILRTALQQAEYELHQLDIYLKEQQELKWLQSKSMEEKLQYKRQQAQSRSKVKKGKSMEKNALVSPNIQKVLIDFTFDGSWQSMANLCTSQVFPGHDSNHHYNYTFCLFDEITQDSTSLGIFSQWGSSSFQLHQMPLLKQYLLQLQHQIKQEQWIQSYGSTSSLLTRTVLDINNLYWSLTTLPVTWTESVLKSWNISNQDVHSQQQSLSFSNHTLLQYVGDLMKDYLAIDLQSNLTEAQKAILLQEQLHYYYTHQIYDSGAKCQLKPNLMRSVQVTLECGANFEILSVSEYSICEYDMIVSIPLACDKYLETLAKEKLELLKVFGFGKHGN